jgi:hypothetical protein
MRLQIKHLLAGSVVLAGASLMGCSSHSDAPYYGAEPVQSGYAEYPSNYAVVEDPYYGQGAYSGDYWVWHDREGHEHREARSAHEQRARAYEQHRSEPSNRGDGGAIRNESNRGAESGAYPSRGAEGQAAGHAETGRGGATAHPGAEGRGGGISGEAHGEGGTGHADGDVGHR